MAEKPVVVLALPPDFCGKMFSTEDLDRLGSEATVLGPFEEAEDVNVLQSALSHALVAITGWQSPKFDERLLRFAPELKLIAHSAGSVRPLVSDAVFDRKIRVTSAAAINAIPVAQYTVAMMVSLLKQIPWISRLYTANEEPYLAQRKALARELMDLNIGIVGASRIGREVIRLLKEYPRLTIKLYDPYLVREEALLLGVVSTTLEEVCRCDVVSLHAPGTPETRHMLNAKLLGLLPDHAVLINTARGVLIDEEALIAEVRRRPLYVCLDVTDPEPPRDDSVLRREPNIILTPHVAGAMKQARKQMGQATVNEVLRFISGQSLTLEVLRENFALQA